MNLMQIFLGELLGTMILILLGNGVVSNVLYKRTKGHNGGPIVIFISWGFAVMIAVITAQSFTTDAGHLNPAVTMFVVVQGGISATLFFTYIGSQILGAAVGQIVVNTFYWNFANNIENKEVVLDCHCNRPVDQSKWFNNIFAEFLGTLILITVIAVLSAGVFKGIDPGSGVSILVKAMIIGFTIMVIGAALGGQTGYSINPARDLIPRVIYKLTPFKNKTSANWIYSWVPVFGPLMAGVVVGLFARLIA